MTTAMYDAREWETSFCPPPLPQIFVGGAGNLLSAAPGSISVPGVEARACILGSPASRPPRVSTRWRLSGAGGGRRLSTPHSLAHSLTHTYHEHNL